MSKGTWFWVILILSVVFGVWAHWSVGDWRVFAPSLLEFVLFFLIGWQVFGPPIQ